MNTESLMKTGSLWFPSLIEENAGRVDFLFWGVFWVSLIIGTAIMAVVAYFMWKYRSRPGHEMAVGQVVHNVRLEAAWIAIPLVLVMALFGWGFYDYLKITVAPADSYEIRAVGRKWAWSFEYPTGVKSDNDLVVPVGRPIKLVMSSVDVLHSFWIPNARRKKDVLPFRYTSIWFKPERTGEFQIFCTEYCGDGHSIMLAKLKVVTEGEFEAWMKTANASSSLPLDQLGQQLFQGKGCFACHSVDGKTGVGPTLKGIFGAARPLVSGESVKADENYLAESILRPAVKVVAGFPPAMSPYEGLLSEREVSALVTYLKTLK